MKIISLLGEAFNQNKANLPLDKDILFKAKQKYPQYSGTQALTLYIADEMKEKDQVDSNQNRLIDTQQRENDRLRGEVQSIGQELENFEQQSMETDREVDRLKKLSGMLSAGGVKTQQQAKSSADELQKTQQQSNVSTENFEKLQKDLQIIKTKPGLDPEKFKSIETQIDRIVKNPAFGNVDLEKVNSLLGTLNKQKNVGDDLYKRLEDQLSKTQRELVNKENRFAKYIEKKKGEVGTMQQSHAGEIQKYAEIVKGYQSQIENFGKEMSQAKNQIQTDRNEIEAMKQRVEKQALNINALVAGTSRKPDIDWLPKGDAANQQQQLKLAEEDPGQQIHNDQGVRKLVTTRDYIDWKNKHIFGIFRLFKLKYNGFINKYGHSDKQIQDVLIKYLPYLYNLGDPSTPLSPKEVATWMEEYVQPALQKEVAQYDVLRQGLHETYARMLDDIIGLDYIKKG
jgi:chromosome segregation ATPase